MLVKHRSYNKTVIKKNCESESVKKSKKYEQKQTKHENVQFERENNVLL